MPDPVYEIRLMFEWGGGSLWGMNPHAKAAFGYAVLEEALPISSATLNKIQDLSELHDTALNWADPAGPSPWTRGDFMRFETKALHLLEELRTELGADYRVYYTPLGES